MQSDDHINFLIQLKTPNRESDIIFEKAQDVSPNLLNKSGENNKNSELDAKYLMQGSDAKKSEKNDFSDLI